MNKVKIVILLMVCLGLGQVYAAIDVPVSGCVIEYDFNFKDLVVETASGDDYTAEIIQDPNWYGFEPVIVPGLKGYCIDNTAIPASADSSTAVYVGIEGTTNSPMQQELNNLDEEVTMTCWVNVDENFDGWSHMLFWGCGSSNYFAYAWVFDNSANRTFLRKDIGNSGPSTSHPPIVEPDKGELDTWIFVAFTYDGSTGSGNNVSWYKGWIDDAVILRSTEQLYAWDFQSCDNKVVFLNHNLDFEKATSMKIDEFRVFNRILSLAEIEQVRQYDLQSGTGSACGDLLHPSPSMADLNNDCIVDFKDVGKLASEWLEETPMP